MTKHTASSYQKLWGLLTYKPRWGLSTRGWLVILAVLSALSIIFISSIHSFLVVSQPISAQVLIVEGWINDQSLVIAAEEIKQRDYRLIITTGPEISKGVFLSEYKNYAQLNAASLVSLGIDEQKIIPVPTPVVKRNRTLATAISVKNWLEEADLRVNSVNLFSYGPHTRRSWIIYRRVLEPEIQVGAIASPPLGYDPRWWWTYSEGVRLIISETIAYIYAKLFVYP